MTIKKAYYYIFYKIYHFAKAISDDALNDIKPGFSIMILEGFIFLGLIVEFTNITKIKIKIGDSIIWTAGIALGLINYFIFYHRNNWKKYNSEFKKYDAQHKNKGGWIVFIIIFLIISHLIFAYYQMSLIDWKKY